MRLRRIPTPPELDRNPELAVLAALETTALAARFAVIAVHPSMRDPGHLYAPTPATQRPADAIVHGAEQLARAIAEYRSAIRRDLALEREQLLPF